MHISKKMGDAYNNRYSANENKIQVKYKQVIHYRSSINDNNVKTLLVTKLLTKPQNFKEVMVTTFQTAVDLIHILPRYLDLGRNQSCNGSG